MQRRNIKHIIAVVVVSVVIILPAAIQIQAYTTSSDVAECQRLDILNGCNCKCSDPGLEQVCRIVGGRGQCVNEAAPLSKGSTTSNVTIRPFPTIGNSGGILIVDSDGDIMIGATGANIFKWLFWILGAVALGFGIYGSYVYSTAGSNEDNVTKARSIMKNALLGFIIAIAGLLIVLILARVFRFSEDPSSIDSKVTDTKTDSEKDADRKEEKDIFDSIFK